MMKKTSVAIATALIAVSGYLLYLDRQEDAHISISLSSDVSSTNNSQSAKRSESNSPQIDETADSNFETVYGIKVRKDRNCTVEPRYIDVGDGTVVEAFTCTPNTPREAGPYDKYDNETLALMSYSDALAAEVLGKRLAEQDPDQARQMMLRSVSLEPQNADPVLWLASAYYSRVATNGVPALAEMSEKYRLTRIAEELGTAGAASAIRQSLLDAGLQEADFQNLEEQLQQDLATIRQIQLEVFGESTLPEVSL
jgi:hypothetical protein